MRRKLHAFDNSVTAYIHRLPLSVRPLMLLMTLIGQPPITVGVATGMIGFGIAKDSQVLIDTGLIAVVTVIIASVLKVFLHRPRPDNEYSRSMLIHTFSFPSGHAAGSIVCFGALAYILALFFPEYALLGGAIVAAISFLIGVSRVYLGAHYPSDVVGGWLVGFAGLVCILLLPK